MPECKCSPPFQKGGKGGFYTDAHSNQSEQIYDISFNHKWHWFHVPFLKFVDVQGISSFFEKINYHDRERYGNNTLILFIGPKTYYSVESLKNGVYISQDVLLWDNV